MLDESELAARIAKRAESCDVALDDDGALTLARHMLRVLAADPSLHLTSIRDPEEFVARHIGESLEGAALLDREVRGALLDLGSGNGYPGLPLVASRRGLVPHLSEASGRKAGFLREVLRDCFSGGCVIERQVQRADDLDDEPRFVVVATRAMGNWERVLPRLVRRLTPDARVLVWAGAGMENVLRRSAWQRFRLIERRDLPGREQSWVWLFGVS